MKFKDHKTARPQDYETKERSHGHVVTWSRGQAFTLVEMLVTLALLSLIVLALMSVFNSTQAAFRAGLTETDFLESGRMAMGLITDDLEKTTPSYGTNSVIFLGFGNPGNAEYFSVVSPVNFYVHAFPKGFLGAVQRQPFVQYLPGSSLQRSNVLEDFFMLTRQNVSGRPSWVGIGYAVDPLSWPTNSLYRFMMVSNVMRSDPRGIFISFTNDVYSNILDQVFKQRGTPFTNTTYWTHLMDGVVDLTVRPYDPNGLAMTNYVEYKYNGSTNTFFNLNTYFFPPLFPPILPAALPVYNCYMFSNAVPASVEVNLGIVEDAVLQRAQGLPAAGALNYLSNHVGQVHLFRQRVWIRNLDPTAYQTQ